MVLNYKQNEGQVYDYGYKMALGCGKFNDHCVTELRQNC